MAMLRPMSIGLPGWRGLNKQTSGGVLPPGWATKALNFVIDDTGRMAVRSGTRAVATAAIAGASSVNVTHYYKDRNGTEVLIAAAANKLWRLDGTSWTDITGTASTPTANNWKFQNFNGKLVAWQSGHNAIVMPTTAGVFADIVPSTGTVPGGTEVLAAWGRLWVIDSDTLYYSDLLDETSWGGASAGQLLLTNAWPAGVSNPTALAEFNNHLCIFGDDQIIIYQGPDNPSDPFGNFAKVEGVAGLGCTARDTIQNVGKDILFLSGQGLRSLGRVIQEKSMPVTDAAPQVRDYILQQVVDGTLSDIKSAFAQYHGFYILVLKNTILVFDLRMRNEDGSFRVTEWNPGYASVAADTDGKLVIGNGGQVFRYQGTRDDVASDGTGGDPIMIDFEGVWNDFDQGQGEGLLIKFLKKVKVYVNGGAGQTISFKWAVDYKSGFNRVSILVPGGENVARWGVAQYSVDHYSGNFLFNTVGAQAGRSGQVIKVGLTCTVDGVPFALDRIMVYTTTGKISL